MGKGPLLQNGGRPQAVAPVYDSDFPGESGQKEGFLNRGISAAHYDDISIPVKGPSQVAQ
jgi:hypothetical protein